MELKTEAELQQIIIEEVRRWPRCEHLNAHFQVIHHPRGEWSIGTVSGTTPDAWHDDLKVAFRVVVAAAQRQYRLSPSSGTSAGR